MQIQHNRSKMKNEPILSDSTYKVCEELNKKYGTENFIPFPKKEEKKKEKKTDDSLQK